MTKKVIIIGGEGKGGPIAAVIEDNRHTFGDMSLEVAGFLNDMELGKTIHNFPVLGGTNEVARFADDGYHFVYAIHMLGRNYKTEELFHQVNVPQELLVNVVSKRAFVAHNAVLKPGACVLVNGYVGAGAEIGACTLVASHAFVGHDTVVGPLSHMAICCVVGSRRAGIRSGLFYQGFSFLQLPSGQPFFSPPSSVATFRACIQSAWYRSGTIFRPR